MTWPTSAQLVRLRELNVGLQDELDAATTAAERTPSNRIDAAGRADRLRRGHAARASGITVDDAPNGEAGPRRGPRAAGQRAVARPAPRRSRSTASGSPRAPRSATPAPRSTSTGIPLSPPYVVTAIGDNQTLQADLLDTATGLEFQHRGRCARLPGDDGQCRRGHAACGATAEAALRSRPAPPSRPPTQTPEGDNAVIAALGLLVGHRARSDLPARRTSRPGALPADRRRRRARRGLRWPARLPRRDLRRQGLRRLVHQQRRDRGRRSSTSATSSASAVSSRPASSSSSGSGSSPTSPRSDGTSSMPDDPTPTSSRQSSPTPDSRPSRPGATGCAARCCDRRAAR